MLSESGGGWYYKRHLVPFGEYFPVPAFVRSWMRLMSLPYDDFTPGARTSAGAERRGTEARADHLLRGCLRQQQLQVLRDATLLINVTNNAWYGDSTAPHQHLQIARMRALEAGRYLVRAANDGITAADRSARAKSWRACRNFKEAVLRADVQPMTGLTPYARLGNYPVIIGAGALLAAAVWRRRRGA